jgi:hypothetical protein
MLQLHAEFRRRHGLPPLPTAWTLLEHLQELGPRALLTDPTAFSSRRHWVGSIITAMRSKIWHALKLWPVFCRQSEINRDIVVALEALTREHEHSRHVHYALSSRLSDLEEAVARLREGHR